MRDGFLKDRRRLNVAISRAKVLMIVLLEESVGRRDGLVWHFRKVLRDLDVEYVLPSGLGIYRCPFIDIHGSTLAYAGAHNDITAVNNSCRHISINKTAVMLLQQKPFEGFDLSQKPFDSLATQPISVPLSNYQSSSYNTSALSGEDLEYSKRFRISHSYDMLAPCSCYSNHSCLNISIFKAKIPLSQLKKLLEPDEPLINYKCELCENCHFVS